jgi:hypothetical protein
VAVHGFHVLFGFTFGTLVPVVVVVVVAVSI